MCHPGLPPLPPGCTVKRRPRQAGVVAPTPVTTPREEQRQAHYYCVCSPTAHRGSFRCRWHRGSYEWGGRGRAAAVGGVP